MIIFARNLVVKDFWLKLFSLALAILIWLTVRFTISGEGSPWAVFLGRSSDERVLTIPIQVPEGATQNFNFEPAEVEVTLRGDPKALKSLRAEDIRAEVNLIGVESASGLLRPVGVFLPSGISYTHLAPDEVEVYAIPKPK
jgi:hypothetical protein